MLQNAYFLAKIGADTAENEQHFAEICQKLATTLRVRWAGGAYVAPARVHPRDPVVRRRTFRRALRFPLKCDTGIQQILASSSEKR